MTPHFSSESCPSSARSDSEQCHTSAATRVVIVSPVSGSVSRAWRVTSTPSFTRGSSRSFAIASAVSVSKTP